MKYLLLFCALMCSQTAFCQDAYYKSSIITLQNDTIKGFVSNIYDSKAFKFKKKQTDKPVVYTPKQLKGVILDGNVFESHAVNVPYYKLSTIDGYNSLHDVPTKGLVLDVDRGRLIDTLFLHKLVNGTINLYKLTTTGGTAYYFAKKYNVLKEIPPLCYVLTTSPKGQKNEEFQPHLSYNGVVLPNGGVFNMPLYVYQKKQYLDTLAYFFNDKTYFTSKSKLKYSEPFLVTIFSQYNKKAGISNGGVLKNKVNRKIFVGVNVGFVALDYDDIIDKTQAMTSSAFKIYALYPLIGMDRNMSAKFAFNYFAYQNEFYKKGIPSVSFGLRYGGLSGLIRPYGECSIAIGGTLYNNQLSKSIDLPLILEGGVHIPIKNAFITLGINRTPVMNYKLNGYKFWAFNAGIMF